MDPSDFETWLIHRAKVESKAFLIFHGLHKQRLSAFVYKEAQESFKLSRQPEATFPKCSYKPSKKNQKKTPQVPLEVCADACQIRMAWKEERKHGFSWSKANFHFTPCWLWLNDQQQVFIGRLKCDWQRACPTTFEFCLHFPNAAGTDG